MPLKKVFVTGANGFLGRAVIDRLIAMGVEVVGLVRIAGKGTVSRARLVQGNITRQGSWCEAMQGCDLVVHTAALVSNDVSYDQAWRANVRGTSVTLQAAINAGVPRFLHTSSVGVYGYNAVGMVSESAPLKTLGHTYSDTKILSEHRALAAHSSGDIKVTIVRPSDIYGPGSRPWVTIPMEVIRKGMMILPAGGQGLLSPVFIDDLVDGLLLAACKPEGSGQIFNIDGGSPLSCLDYFQHLYRLLGKSGKPLCLGKRSAFAIAEVVGVLEKLLGKGSEVGKDSMMMLNRQNCYSIDKAQRLLGFTPKIELDEGMERVAVSLRAQGII